MPSDAPGLQAPGGTAANGFGFGRHWLRRAIDVRGHEIALLGWSWLYVLSVMSAYYVIRPIRDAMGVEGGVENLQWLFTGTLLVMLAINPAYAAIVRILPRQRFIALAYLFFIANLAIFALLLQVSSGTQLVWVGRAFFIWVSVFNLFVVSVFWALMVDIFDSEQGERLFGSLAAGATLGAIFGSGLTASLSTAIGATWLLLASAAFLLLAILSVRRLSRLTSVLHRPAASVDPLASGSGEARAATAGGSAGGTAAGGTSAGGTSAAGAEAAGAVPVRAASIGEAPVGAASVRAASVGAAPSGELPIGGSVMAGITHTVRSPYLLNISLYILLYSITSTFLYFQQAAIVRDYFPDRASRTTFFAGVDLAVNVLTLVVQLFLTSRFLRAFGVAVTAAVLPFCTLIGFGALAAFPTLVVFVVVQVVRRVGNFGLARPTRELLFTVVSREDKYKAKSVIDTVVYRAGDQVGSWSYALLGMLGAGPVGVAVAALPISALWLGNALWLGRRQKAMAGVAGSAPPDRPA